MRRANFGRRVEYVVMSFPFGCRIADARGYRTIILNTG